MDIFERAGAYLRPRLDRQLLVFLLPLALLFVAWPQNLSARQDEQDPAQASQGQQYIQQTPEQSQQLVAPIALYPNSLVAQILAAVQVMRQRAQEAGKLKNTEQQTVTTQDSNIVIEAASPEIVYVPAYDPWVVYGGPIVAWPGWYPYPGIWYGGPYLSFGVGFGIGYIGGYGWGWHHWGSYWHHRVVIHDHDRYYSRSTTFYNRNNYYRGGDARGGANRDRGADRARSNEERRLPSENARERGGESNRPGATASPFEGSNKASRGYAEPRGQSGTRSGAFSNYDHGGHERSFSSRGSASFGGGGGARGGGGRH